MPSGPSLSFLTSVFSNELIDQTYIKVTARIHNFFLPVQLATCTVSNSGSLKIPVAEGHEDFGHENVILDKLSREPCCADIVQSFLRLPTANFMAFYSGGTLDQRPAFSIVG